MKQVEQEVFVPKDEGVAREVLPTKIQRRMFNETIPGVVDVLTDVVEQCFHHKRSNMSRHHQYRDAWRYVPPVRDTRRVLVIVNLEQVRPALSELGHDHMDMTSCSELPGLSRMGELALFTYHVLIHLWARLVGMSPHGWIVPRAGSIRLDAYVIR